MKQKTLILPVFVIGLLSVTIMVVTRHNIYTLNNVLSSQQSNFNNLIYGAGTNLSL